MSMPAQKQSVLLGVDAKGVSHVIAKGPEAGFVECRTILCDLTDKNGVAKIAGGEVQLVSAALLGNGRYHKRRSFDPARTVKAAKPAEKKAKAPKK